MVFTCWKIKQVLWLLSPRVCLVRVHEIRDFFWDGIASRGASWLREEPIEEIWKQVILVPVCGGMMVGALNSLHVALKTPSEGTFLSDLKAASRPFLKAVAAAITLGTGNSLGPEGPSVEIGASIAKGVGNLFECNKERKLSLLAAGSAAGISSGFNAAVAGCFFAVESVLWPSPEISSLSLTNTTSMVILSAVIASVVSEAGLGSEPAFRVPEYDFRSPSELPLYLLLGILCGLVSLALSRSTSYALTAVDNVQKATGAPKAVFPVFGGLVVGLIALAYPEILYWGFENVDILLESRPLVKGLPAHLLLQLIGVKILATSLCRASGLVGGYYAPSLFIGAATGMAYGKFASFAVSQLDPTFHLSILEVASPQAYGLVGMAATLAGVCQVPLTAVLLLFELTQDYRIVLPLLGAVGLSSWITSGKTRKRDIGDKMFSVKGNCSVRSPSNLSGLSSSSVLATGVTHATELCELESSLCVDDSSTEFKDLEERISVSQAMRTRFVTVLMNTLLTEAVALMLAEKQSCAVIVDNDNLLIGFLTLDQIQEFSKLVKDGSAQSEVQKLQVSEMCHSNCEKCSVPWTVTPDMNLVSAQRIMARHGISQLPVVSEIVEDHRGHPIGLLDRECIHIACRAVATRESLRLSSIPKRHRT
ncbi:PREDICTED: chloride channel protein CLC-e isoform X3 [Nelumbo nucifera]|uniref:Chloride channel protein n=1 Tax=Nelumbo nucifera TaxID=4432 RepID=A0A1U8ARV3_NELNU|nr:PREDICTED: chloride channel protein CLC-e isoform X3 [Nelumbo nucifera]XP_010270658.1 PREDICTED: chloride channel protein CLC-e isoform X3 [Nelumbo nucifera]